MKTANPAKDAAMAAATSKKVPPHRKAIQEASKITGPGTTSNSATATSTQSPAPSGQTQGSFSLSQAEVNEDYETSKVNKSKKAQYDADIAMVKELDRWG